ncbi:uncharacterized protein BX663DRAFT_485669 [Cokeromyces recurvatus]|uniref:uncharacterized protein n=1 Tax=Cokeromyces recurvatus TaxID=90255 RepID=UPI00221F5BE7|nr:uncharacterized protein BX663DRAFT_485669 [Cokeromyces recurvatus]KAI7903524.1 hypothetical protein BX663DRAFT_485669 [Cokeromyces recurvatus]
MRTQRRYATPEESEAVFPVFTTPTDMYLNFNFSSQSNYTPSPQAAYRSSPYLPQNYNNYEQQSKSPLNNTSIRSSSSYPYNRPRGESNPVRPNLNSFANTSNGSSSFSSTSSTTSIDTLLAQLLEMGFTLEASKAAIAVSGGSDLQNTLDILIQGNHKTEASGDSYQVSSEEEDEEIWKRKQEERRREYINQLKRNKPTPPTPPYTTKSPTPSPHVSTTTTATTTTTTATPNTPPQIDPAVLYADNERKQGNYLFNKGQFVEAEAAYTIAIRSLPAGHGDLVLLCNNRAAARLKLGKYKECLEDCGFAVNIAQFHISHSTPLSPIMTSTSSTMKSQLIKALHRKACALEGLCLFEAAIQAYQEYIQLDGSRTVQVTQSILRCQQAALFKSQTKQQQQQQEWKTSTFKNDTNESAFPDIDFDMFIPKKSTKLTQAELDEINKSKAVQEMREREKKKEAEEAERFEKEDKVNHQLKVWISGKDKNLRALLSSLDMILWPGVQWKGVMMSELLDAKKCKMTYMKAIAKVHPDKLPANSTVEQRLLASGIFTALNQAWDVFKTENNL